MSDIVAPKFIKYHHIDDMFVHYVVHGEVSMDNVVDSETLKKLASLVGVKSVFKDIPKCKDHNKVFYYLSDVFAVMVHRKLKGTGAQKWYKAIRKERLAVMWDEALHILFKCGYVRRNNLRVIFHGGAVNNLKDPLPVGKYHFFTVEEAASKLKRCPITEWNADGMVLLEGKVPVDRLNRWDNDGDWSELHERPMSFQNYLPVDTVSMFLHHYNNPNYFVEQRAKLMPQLNRTVAAFNALYNN